MDLPWTAAIAALRSIGSPPPKLTTGVAAGVIATTGMEAVGIRELVA